MNNFHATPHRNAVTSQFLCSRVQCGNATQLRCSMNGPEVDNGVKNWVWQKVYDAKSEKKEKKKKKKKRNNFRIDHAP